METLISKKKSRIAGIKVKNQVRDMRGVGVDYENTHPSGQAVSSTALQNESEQRCALAAQVANDGPTEQATS